MSDVDIDKN